MRFISGWFLFSVVCICFLPVTMSVAHAHDRAEKTAYQKIDWEELVPEDWKPESLVEGLDLDALSDDDPRTEKVFQAFMEKWQQAPANKDMDGRYVQLAGFIAPLDWESEGVLKEFLLVPYFGACIHVPPPPPNQIIHIRMNKPLKGIRTMDTVQVFGKLTLERTESGSMGVSGYSMKPDKVEPYKP